MQSKTSAVKHVDSENGSHITSNGEEKKPLTSGKEIIVELKQPTNSSAIKERNTCLIMFKFPSFWVCVLCFFSLYCLSHSKIMVSVHIQIDKACIK